MKRVLIFSLTYYPDLIGGAEIPVREITGSIDPNDVAFDMVTLRFDSALPEVEKIGNVTVYRVGFTRESPRVGDLVKSPLKWNKYIFPFIGFWKARKLHKKHAYDATWSVMTSYASFAAVFFKIMYPQVKYLFTMNDGDPIDYLKRRAFLVYPLFVRIFTLPDLIHAPSNYLAGFARQMGYTGKIELIPNAIDVKNFAREYPEGELDAIRKKLGKNEGEIFLITTSRLVKKNGVDDSIKSLKFLSQNIVFLILGKGPDLEMLQALAKNEGVENRVRFLGHADPTDVPKYLKVSDVFVRPSLSEGMGNSPIEAMAAGIPVVATQEGGLADSIIDPDLNSDKTPTARAVKVRDPEGIARQVKAFLEKKEETLEITKNAREFSLSRYDKERVLQQMKEDVFGPILGAHLQ